MLFGENNSAPVPSPVVRRNSRLVFITKLSLAPRIADYENITSSHLASFASLHENASSRRRGVPSSSSVCDRLS
jgi:hypothetical protein